MVCLVAFLDLPDLVGVLPGLVTDCTAWLRLRLRTPRERAVVASSCSRRNSDGMLVEPETVGARWESAGLAWERLCSAGVAHPHPHPHSWPQQARCAEKGRAMHGAGGRGRSRHAHRPARSCCAASEEGRRVVVGMDGQVN